MKMFITKISMLAGLACFAITPVSAQSGAGNTDYGQQAATKVANIGNIVPLDTTQQRVLKKAYAAYSVSSDSIGRQTDKHAREKGQRKVNKQWQAALMNTLNDGQRQSYLSSITKPTADSLVAADMAVLQNSNLFSADELQTMKNTLAEYHKQEQFILERDKYDINSRRENIEWLKKRSSKTYKMCEHILKMQQAGVLKNGTIVWQTNN